METMLSLDLGKKLVFILQTLTSSNPKIADEAFLGKLLTSIRNELLKNSNKISNLEELITWLTTSNNLSESSPTVLAFVIQLIGILSENEDIFRFIQTSQFHSYLHNLRNSINQNINLKLSYITLLSNIVNHKSGCKWVLDEKLWKEVVDIYLSNSGLFVEREAITVLTKLLENIGWDGDVLGDILAAIIAPLEHYKKEFEVEHMTENNVELFQRKLEVVVVPVLQAYTTILETWVISAPSKSNISSLKSGEIEPFWKFLLETNNNESLLEKVSVAYALQSICPYYNMQCLTPIKGLPDCLFEIFKILLKRKKIINVIKLAKYCQLFWNKATLNFQDKDCADIENHFIIIQMVPALLLLKKPKQENCMLDMYITKLFELTTGNTLRLVYLLRDVIKYEENEHTMDYAFQAILSITKNMETLNLNRAVLIFQTLTNVLKMFVPRGCEMDEPISDEQYESQQMLCYTKEPLLSSILNAICVLIEKFKINWTEALESLCLLKFSSLLLSNPNLSPRLGVQTLSLIKLAILNFMAPNLVLLVDKIEGTSFECLIKILYNRLHDPNWEVRDSCVEVIAVIAELAETKYPLFQDFLIRGNYCELILTMIEGDSESYVRSSALKALGQMIRIESLRNRYLNNIDLISKISVILRNESEGIVRREAAYLAKELFESKNCRSGSVMSLFIVMGYAATRDLHWEVKVNALAFWEKVIQRLIADQGMIDGFFPSVTFSKEEKKIVSLTNNEIKSRLKKVLNELSDIGCLHILVTTLKDDYDFQVVKKSAEILTDLLDTLKRYDLLEKEDTDSHTNEKCSMKRKASDKSSPEKKISHTVTVGNEESEANKSDRIIEDIVNELDLNLLGNVYNPSVVTPVANIENFQVKKIQPDLFLKEMKNINIGSLLNAKRKWLMSREDDLNELLSDLLTLTIENETNVLDCY